MHNNAALNVSSCSQIKITHPRRMLHLLPTTVFMFVFCIILTQLIGNASAATCYPGQYCNSNGVCVSCPLNTFSTCQVGTYVCPTSIPENGYCRDCPSGATSRVGSANCLCPVNSYASTNTWTTKTYCIDCPSNGQSSPEGSVVSTGKSICWSEMFCRVLFVILCLID